MRPRAHFKRREETKSQSKNVQDSRRRQSVDWMYDCSNRVLHGDSDRSSRYGCSALRELVNFDLIIGDYLSHVAIDVRSCSLD